jgi:hypothetical protein
MEDLSVIVFESFVTYPLFDVHLHASCPFLSPFADFRPHRSNWQEWPKNLLKMRMRVEPLRFHRFQCLTETNATRPISCPPRDLAVRGMSTQFHRWTVNLYPIKKQKTLILR